MGYFRFICLNFDSHFIELSIIKVVFDYVPTDIEISRMFEHKRARR